VICAKTAEPIEMMFGLWARMGVGIMCYIAVQRWWGRYHGNQFWDAICYNWLCGL